MSKIILASSSEEENYILRRKVEPALDRARQNMFLSVRPQGLAGVMDPDVALAILNIATYQKEHRALIKNLREHYYSGPMLVLAKNEIPEIVDELRSMKNTVFLEKPYAAKDLHGIIVKLMKDQQVAQRIHRRFSTVQRGLVDYLEKNESSSTMVLNLSKSGAYFEIPVNKSVRVGELLKLKIQLEEIRRVYAMPARVVWTSPDGSTGPGVGVEFIGPGEMILNSGGFR